MKPKLLFRYLKQDGRGRHYAILQQDQRLQAMKHDFSLIIELGKEYRIETKPKRTRIKPLPEGVAALAKETPSCV